MKSDLESKTQDELIKVLTDFYNQENSDVISAVAHDVKNPLGIIELSVGLMEDRLEKVLEGQDEKLVSKIKSFMGNINVALDRCQAVLDHTIIFRKYLDDDKVTKVNAHDFINEFYIYSKPSLKRKRINFENIVETEKTFEGSLERLSKALCFSLIYCSQNIQSENSIFLTIDFNENTFTFKFKGKEDLPVKYVESTEETHEVFNHRLKQYFDEKNIKFNFEESGNDFIASLSF